MFWTPRSPRESWGIDRLGARPASNGDLMKSGQNTTWTSPIMSPRTFLGDATATDLRVLVAASMRHDAKEALARTCLLYTSDAADE